MFPGDVDGFHDGTHILTFTTISLLYAGQDSECESDDDAHMGDDPEQRAQIATAQQTKL